MTKQVPYVGVTGFMAPAEVNAARAAWASAWSAIGKEPSHRLMIGVLAGIKTLAGQVNKYPRRYPPRDEIAGLFPTDDGTTVNLIHYATGGATFELGSYLLNAMMWAGPNCHGIQVNAIWPDPLGIRVMRARHHSARVVLQLGPGALSQMQWQSRAIAERVRDDYGDSVTDVLIDVSGGRGVPVDPAKVVALIADLRDHGDWRIGVAGGLCAEAMLPLGVAIDLRELSVDAEGRLRDATDGGGDLVPEKVAGYLTMAVRAIQGDTP